MARTLWIVVLALATVIAPEVWAQLSPDRIAEKRATLAQQCGDRVAPEVLDIIARNPTVDAHAHAFNLRYLPIAGILYRYRLPAPLGEILADILVNATEGGMFNPRRDEALSGSIDDLLSRLTDEERETLQDAEGEIQKALERNSRDNEQVVGKPLVTPRPTEAYVSNQEGARSLAMLLRLVDDGVHSEEARDLSQGANEESFFDLISVLTLREDKIAGKLMSSFPIVDIFVHHMMDIGSVYNASTNYPIETQIDRVVELGRLMPTRLRFSIAYDPFTSTDSITAVQRGISEGAVAIKFYPPSGYRPACNLIPKKPGYYHGRFPFLYLPLSARHQQRKQWKSRYQGRTGADIDAAAMVLFRTAHEAGTPIFSHHTPQGFEAQSGTRKKPGYGMIMARPYYWRPVLDQIGPDFRLVLAHSGGGASWYSDNEWNGSFDQEAYELCTRYPNVYCDFGMSIEILTPEGRQAFLQRLLELLNNPPAVAQYQDAYSCSLPKLPDRQFNILDKLVYGSDWHMMARIDNREDLLCSFGEVFSSPELRSGAEGFFGANAHRAFGLD